MARTRTARRPSANGRAFRTAGKQSRWAIEATQGSRDMPRHPQTRRAGQQSCADNPSLLEGRTQAFGWMLASPYFVRTALTWIPLLFFVAMTRVLMLREIRTLGANLAETLEGNRA